jgi:hypothetical protein
MQKININNNLNMEEVVVLTGCAVLDSLLLSRPPVPTQTTKKIPAA